MRDNNNFMKQRRLTVTPTLDYYLVQLEDETCLALRKYKDHIEKFVRVTFANEYLTRGFYQQQTDGGQSLLLGFVHNIIKHGVPVYDSDSHQPGAVLKFLSYSNSQMKGHSAWFLLTPVEASDNTLNENVIMDSMGNFSHEMNVLKKYARRGQCFSTAKFILNLEPSMIIYDHPDIKRNGFVFTDGCGHIT